MANVEEQKDLIPANLGGMFLASAKEYADRIALRYKPGHYYHELSYGQLRREVLRLVKALTGLGLKEGDKAVIISENRPEWAITDLAMMCSGLVNVPIHDVLSPVQVEAIINEVAPKAIFFSNDYSRAKFLGIAKISSEKLYLISFEKPTGKKAEHLLYFKDLVDSQRVSEEELALLEASAKKLRPDALASIGYTSGTGGRLKGVMLTHKNFIHNIEGIKGSIFATHKDKVFSILPLSHIFERTAGYYVPLSVGSSICYRVDPSSIVKEMQAWKPTVVIAAPRFYEKIHENIWERVSRNPFRKYMVRAAFSYKPKSTGDVVAKLFDKLVFSKIREVFGGSLRFFISGGAKLPEKIGKFFDRAGLVILEGYGLTETSPVIASNRLDKYKFGTVGPVLKNLSVKIGEGSEILVKGLSVSGGYVRQDDNKNMFTEDGYFRTGDSGYIDAEGHLVISGRIKDIVVLVTGKKIIPSVIEEALKRSPYIEQAMVIGEGRKHVGALIVPRFEALEKKFAGMDREELLKDGRTKEFFAAVAREMTKDLASIERIQKFILLKEPFNMEKGEMTPKLSLRRNVISARHEDLINKMYNS